MQSRTIKGFIREKLNFPKRVEVFGVDGKRYGYYSNWENREGYEKFKLENTPVSGKSPRYRFILQDAKGVAYGEELV